MCETAAKSWTVFSLHLFTLETPAPQYLPVLALT